MLFALFFIGLFAFRDPAFADENRARQLSEQITSLQNLNSKEAQKLRKDLSPDQLGEEREALRLKLYALASAYQEYEMNPNLEKPVWFSLTKFRMNALLKEVATRPEKVYPYYPQIFPILNDGESALLQVPFEKLSPKDGTKIFYTPDKNESYVGPLKEGPNFMWDLKRWLENCGYKIEMNYPLTSPQNAADPSKLNTRKVLASNEIPFAILRLVDTPDKWILLKNYLAAKTIPSRAAEWDSFQLLLRKCTSLERCRLMSSMVAIRKKWGLLGILEAANRLPDPSVKTPRAPDLSLEQVVRELGDQQTMLKGALHEQLSVRSGIPLESLLCEDLFRRPEKSP